MKLYLMAAFALATAACSPAQPLAERPRGELQPMPVSKTITVVERNGYRIVDLRGQIVDWGKTSEGPEQRARLVLVPHGAPAPALAGDLQGATLIRTPVRRIATNAGPHEAMLTELGINDRIVAVGGPYSYNDELRDRARSGKVAKIGYGWHSPPHLDVLVASRPDLLLMTMADISHAQHLNRIQALGIPVVPTFFDSEPDYRGAVDYVRLVGMLTGKEAEANAYADTVLANVERLRAIAARQPKRSMVFAWWGGGDRWMATIRNADAQVFREAGGINLLEGPDDPERDAFNYISTEAMLTRATDAGCWVVRDPLTRSPENVALLSRFRAFREGCMFAIDGRRKLDRNAYDLYETAVFRPDWMLADFIRMLHPHAAPEAARYLQPDSEGPSA